MQNGIESEAKFKNKEELGDDLCKFCLTTNKGKDSCIGTPDGHILCEGEWCNEAYLYYLEEEKTNDRKY